MIAELSVAEQAAVWQQALRGRYVASRAAVAWADGLIARMDAPPTALFDVSLAGNKDVADVASLLSPLAQGVTDSPRLIVAQLYLMAWALEDDPTCAQAVAWAVRDLSDGPLRGHSLAPELYVLPYSWDPEESGWVPTPQEATATLRAALPQLASYYAPAG